MSYFTIEPYYNSFFRGFAVYEHDEYPRSSILAGQYRRTQREMFETVSDAKKEWPTARVLDHSSKPVTTIKQRLAELSNLPPAPPEWFDAADAGESWDDDY